MLMPKNASVNRNIAAASAETTSAGMSAGAGIGPSHDGRILLVLRTGGIYWNAFDGTGIINNGSADGRGKNRTHSMRPGQRFHCFTYRTGCRIAYWDGLPQHRSKIVADYLNSTDGNIAVEYLPGYASELNPTEYVWAYLPSCSQSVFQIGSWFP
jgi:hypothetical protein